MERIIAVQAIRQLRGSAQSQLLLGSDERLWVVKFKNNPQGLRVLANEFLASRLGAALGFSVPETSIVQVEQWLVEDTPAMWVNAEQGGRVACSVGNNFGSLYAGGLMPNRVLDYMPQDQLCFVQNIKEFAGIFAFDKWTCNTDFRQAVFWRDSRSKRYKATFIDQGCCFSGNDWRYDDSSPRGMYRSLRVYDHVTDWESFEPWLSKIETFDPNIIYDLVQQMPPEWYEGDDKALDELIDGLISRRASIRGLLEKVLGSHANPFLNWNGALKRPDSYFLM